MHPDRIEPGPGQESVWDYPRPPRVEPTARHVRIVLAGEVVADSTRTVRVLETSHPPVYYIPAEDVRTDLFDASERTSSCEFKGRAEYFCVRVGDVVRRNAAWSYPDPAPAFAAIAGHIAFYPGQMDECTVDGEVVRAQEGDFYGGWITSDIIGPFKGGPETRGW